MDDEDDDLWALVTRDIAEIRREKPIESAPEQPKSPSSKSSKKSVKPKITKTVSAVSVPATQSTSVDKKTQERFRRGLMPVDARLDLHGLSQNKAHSALMAFLKSQYAQGGRMLLIITGKGNMADGRRDPLLPSKGILKQRVPEWLQEPEVASIILSTAPAKPKDGGEGALYVLLRRRR